MLAIPWCTAHPSILLQTVFCCKNKYYTFTAAFSIYEWEIQEYKDTYITTSSYILLEFQQSPFIISHIRYDMLF